MYDDFDNFIKAWQEEKIDPPPMQEFYNNRILPGVWLERLIEFWKNENIEVPPMQFYDLPLPLWMYVLMLIRRPVVGLATLVLLLMSTFVSYFLTTYYVYQDQLQDLTRIIEFLER